MKVIPVPYRPGMWLILLMACSLHLSCSDGSGDFPTIERDRDGGLQYIYDARGNRVPDFSYCGYKASESYIPDVPVRLVLPHVEGDAAPLLQAAIEELGRLPADKNGFRGAILLGRGVYQLEGRVRIEHSGIVIRGSGTDEDGTVLLAEGEDRMTLIRVAGSGKPLPGKACAVEGTYVPVNAMEVPVQGPHDLKKGDRVLVHRPSTKEWIGALGMGEFGGGISLNRWKPGQRDLYWDRTVTGVKGNTILLDAPITTALDPDYGGGELIPYTWPGRIRNIGIENLKLVSAYDPSNPKDEDHCWMAVTMENVEDAWVRCVEFEHFAGSAVAVYESARRITVEDCISLAPVSEIGGQRRYSFFTMGQQCLFQRIHAEDGYHDFAAGFCAAGPNAFVQCESLLPHSFSGAIDSWASGLLMDIVNVEGQAIRFKNREQEAMGTGWCAANSVLWQCSASRIDCYAPPTADNWAFGCWAEFAGDGHWAESNNHIRPRSLFYAQLAGRLGKPVEDFVDRILPFRYISTTSPTPELAVELTAQAYEPAPSLLEWIRGASLRHPITLDAEGAEVFRTVPSRPDKPAKEISPIRIENGWLASNGVVLAGDRISVPFWRGDPRPYAAAEARPAVTRFVPGRYGWGYTDELDYLAAWLERNHITALEHQYGLWYDRRRDDHERIRRMDGEVWAPFYEQPFARSGKGLAWDGLSKYDLTKFNPWYWDRLREFADRAEDRGIILVHQHYFQHNILEAGAHWADFPWRTANNVNGTGFPEPPNYAGDKRIFMDAQFYDTTHPVRKELHRQYIRKCLDNFAGNSNVIHLVSAEYTGPLHFVQFWLDVIREWESETGMDARVGLSATKDVQDAILNDPVRSAVVDLIDLRYWAYREDGSLYAPEGGQHMAPRQHARKIPPGDRSFDQVYRAVLEYRTSFPGKAVTCSERESAVFGWAVFMAGGSLPRLPGGLPREFLEDAAAMEPVSPAGQKDPVPTLKAGNGERIAYVSATGSTELDLTDIGGTASAFWINPATGRIIKETGTLETGGTIGLAKPAGGPMILWLKIDHPKIEPK